MLEFTPDPLTGAGPERTGWLALPHGRVETPVFMPVGTQGSIKGLELSKAAATGFRLILANTYHLFFRPGAKLIKEHGGLHGFMQWPHNILTDSGGFQVFSLSPLRKITDEGVRFQSHVDGQKAFLSPEEAVRVQCDFNSDIQMALDVCTAPETTEKKALGAVLTTTQWARRAKAEWQNQVAAGYAGNLFGIIQGNFYKDLRKRSALELLELDFPGYAIGGLSVGEPYEVFQDFLAYTASFLPADKPRYLMGIGTPEYILEAVRNGIDMFDCVFPTRVARNGTFFTRHGRLVIKNEKYKDSLEPIDPESPVAAYSRAYLRHLFKSNEMLGPMLATQHNLWFLERMMREIRSAIRAGQFEAYRRNFLANYTESGRD